MKNYSTKQRQILIDYFKKHIDETVSTSEIISELDTNSISESAIYRNLASLEKEGKIRRVSKAGERKTYYQYIDDIDCKGHIHISCIKCGKTSHISDDVTNRIKKSIKNEDDFLIDNDETIIYGICKDCQNK